MEERLNHSLMCRLKKTIQRLDEQVKQLQLQTQMWIKLQRKQKYETTAETHQNEVSLKASHHLDLLKL